MSAYTFYRCTPGGGANSFKALELGSDAEAPARALKMLTDEPVGTYVAVWNDEGAVMERRRDADGQTDIASAVPSE